MRTHDELLRHAGFVRGLARKLAGDSHEDIEQETWLAAIKQGPRHRSNVRGWLARIVRNKVLMARRAAGRRAARERSARRPADTPPVDEAVGRLELHELLVRETLALREPYRTVLILRYFDGLSPAAIAQRLGVPRRTVATRLHRALAHLRLRLDGACGGREAWTPALLAAAEPGRMAWKGAALMASKLTFAVGGFVLGAAMTFTVTETRRTESAPRTTARRAEAQLPPPEQPEGLPEPAPAKSAQKPALRPEELAEHYLRRINEAADHKQLTPIANEMMRLDPKVSRDLLLEIYDRIQPESRRIVMAQHFAQHLNYPYVTDMLHCCARDGWLDIRQWALRTLKQYTLIDFEESPDAYAAWRARAAGMTRAEVIADGARNLAQRLRRLDDAELQKELRIFSRPPFVSRAFKEAGLLDTFRDIVDRPVPEDEHDRTGPFRYMQSAAWNWIAAMNPDEAFLKAAVLPHARRLNEPGTGSNPVNAIGVLAKSKLPWVFDELVTLLRTTKGQEFQLGGAFAELGDKRAIPHLIGAIEADPQYRTIYGLGYFGLGRLTGVRYDKAHNGTWWLAWWDRNRDDLPPDVRALDPRRLR